MTLRTHKLTRALYVYDSICITMQTLKILFFWDGEQRDRIEINTCTVLDIVIKTHFTNVQWFKHIRHEKDDKDLNTGAFGYAAGERIYLKSRLHNHGQSYYHDYYQHWDHNYLSRLFMSFVTKIFLLVCPCGVTFLLMYKSVHQNLVLFKHLNAVDPLDKHF